MLVWGRILSQTSTLLFYIMKQNLHITKLNNGAEILFVNVAGSTSYYFNTIVNAGYNYAAKDKYELPHLLEHLAFEGSVNYPKTGQMAHQLEKLGGWSNAYTSEQNIRYFLVGSINDYKNITEIGLEQYVHPLFRQKNIDEQKKVVEREFKRGIDDDERRVRDLSYSRMFAEKLSFAKDRISTLKNITKSDIETYYKATHTQANTKFVISGDLDKTKRATIALLIEQSVASLPVGKHLNELHHFNEGSFQSIESLPSKLKGQMHFSLSFVKTKYDDSIGYRAACSVAMAIYNQGSSSRVFIKSREAGLAYTVTSGIYNGRDYSEAYVIEKTDPHLATRLFELCLAELVDISKGNFTAAELERAIGYQAGDCDTEYETSRDLADWYGPMFEDDETMYSPVEYSAAIRKIRKQDVVKVLTSFVKKDNWLVSLVGHGAESLKPSFEEIIAKYL